jgi:hypothetical protein
MTAAQLKDKLHQARVHPLPTGDDLSLDAQLKALDALILSLIQDRERLRAQLDTMGDA